MKYAEVPGWCWISVLCKFAESTTVRSLYPYITTLAAAMGVRPDTVAPFL